MSIEIKIVANSFEEMVMQLGGAARLFIVSPPSGPLVQVDAEAPVEAEVVDPPKKPGRPRKQAQTIDAVANPEPEPTTPEEPKPVIEAENLDLEKDIRPAIIAFVNDAAKKHADSIKGDDAKGEAERAAARATVFNAFREQFGIVGLKELKPEQFADVLKYIAERS